MPQIKLKKKKKKKLMGVQSRPQQAELGVFVFGTIAV